MGGIGSLIWGAVISFELVPDACGGSLPGTRELGIDGEVDIIFLYSLDQRREEYPSEKLNNELKAELSYLIST